MDVDGRRQGEMCIADRCMADAIGSAFSLVPDKAQAWMDLHRLTQDKDSYVRWSAAGAIGSAFSLVPDKAQAWMDLHLSLIHISEPTRPY